MNTIVFLQSFASPILDKLFQVVTMTAEEMFFIIIMTIIFWCINKKLGYLICFSLVFSTFINVSLKALFNSPRPVGIEGIRSLRVETAGGSSFPSGHTQATTTFWATLWFGKRNKVLGVIGLVTALLVAVSRLYLGLHWPKDVVASLFIGVGSAYLIYYLYTMYEDKMANILLYMLVIPVIIAIIFIGDSHIIKMGGIAIGIYLGYLIEKKHINFDPSATIPINFIKILLGISGLLLIKTGLALILPDTSFSNLFRYALIGFWIDAIAPWLFVRLKLAGRLEI